LTKHFWFYGDEAYWAYQFGSLIQKDGRCPRWPTILETDNSSRIKTGGLKMRRLSSQFMNDLNTGFLAPFRDRVIADRSLCLEIREDYVNIYYRGGNLLRISKTPTSYVAFFDPEYAGSDFGALSVALPATEIKSSAEVTAWLSLVPTLKQYMDLSLGRHPKEEREAQQLILRENNFGGVSRATDYYICDIEYANAHGRFDLVAVHWPSNGAIRKKADDRRLVLVEAKYGEGAIANNAGVKDHIEDINKFLADSANLAALKEEMVILFNQKRALGLINCGKDLAAFSDAPPMLLLVLVNHDPESTKLRTALESLPVSPNAELYLATGCLMGYGLFDPAMHPLKEARKRFGTCI
jgi:hypothetical protein